jgi:hypothetical protein
MDVSAAAHACTDRRGEREIEKSQEGKGVIGERRQSLKELAALIMHEGGHRLPLMTIDH